jgi:hypothetical protein
MRNALLATLAAIGLGACGTDHRKPDDDGVGTDVPFTECGGDPQSFVRQSFLSLTGRRPKSQAEVDVYADLYAAVKTAGGDPKETVARAIMERPEFADRWIETFMDAMHVQRIDVQNEASCWDRPVRTTVDSGLAMSVRSQAATTAGDGKGAWTMADLARSTIALDDPTPLYRAQLFSMVAHPIPAANVPAKEAELARRADFGETFDSGFLHRDIVCLGCHTSERSVTDSDDPVIDRHWPVPGLAEKAVFGSSGGIEPDRAHAMFRVDDFVDRGSARPWGWSQDCGQFATSVPDDIANIDGKFASLMGKRITVYDLERALARGFDQLRGQLPAIGTDGAITDPDAALAWLVTLKITEDVWKRATGTSLTIANYYPRNQHASDLLYALATRFTQSGFSIKALLVAIVQSDYFNRQAPEAGCGKTPYTYPAVFDPWVTADADPERRFNGPGDAVTAVDARTLVTATNAALDWAAPPAVSRFPDYGDGCEESTCSQMQSYCSQFQACCNSHKAACLMGGVMPSVQVPFERGVGMFLRNSERGFRGLDFQARLVWEDRFGACNKPTWMMVEKDFIEKLVVASAGDATATVKDVASAIKDRIIGEPAIVDANEIAAMEGLFGVSLDMPASAVTAAAARQLCGALLGSPQFLLQGVAGRGGDRPKLTPAEHGYDAICADVATKVAGRTVMCGGGRLSLQ